MSTVLICPLCRTAVDQPSRGCLQCRLPAGDLVARPRSARAGEFARALWIRVLGLIGYSAVLCWFGWKSPDTLFALVPAAAVGGGILHLWKGRVWLGLAVFLMLTLLIPLLIAPAQVSGFFADIRS